MGELWDAFTEALRLLVTGDAQTWEIVGRSLRISLTATAIAFALGLPVGALLAFGRFRGRRLALAVVNTGMGVPPIVAGLVITDSAVALRPVREPAACCTRPRRW